jgi:hypothetical protein
MSFGLVNSKEIATKAALKAAINTGAILLVFDTSLHHNRGTIPITSLEPSDVIVGPNVHDNRKWYANYKNEKIV